MNWHSRMCNPGPRNSSSVEWRAPLTELSTGTAEVEAVTRVVRPGWWTSGPVTDQLEKEFADYLGVEHALAVSSGTAALHLAFLALGLSKGAEVVTPSLNFVASANIILHAQGLPRFADVASLQSPLVCVGNLEKPLTSGTRGICNSG